MPNTTPDVPFGSNSPEEVALKLFQLVSSVERRVFSFMSDADLDGRTVADRNYILDTYANCLTAVRGERNRSSPSSIEPAPPAHTLFASADDAVK